MKKQLILVVAFALVLVGAGCKKKANETVGQKTAKTNETPSVQNFDNGKISFTYPGSLKIKDNTSPKGLWIDLTSADSKVFIEMLEMPTEEAAKVSSTSFVLVRQCMIYDMRKKECVSASAGGYIVEKIKNFVVTYRSNAPDNSEQEKENVRIFQSISNSLKAK